MQTEASILNYLYQEMEEHMMKKSLMLLAACVLVPVSIFANGNSEAKETTIEFWTHEDANSRKSKTSIFLNLRKQTQVSP